MVLQAMQQQRQVAEGGGGTTGGGAAAGAPSSLAAQLELLPAGGVPVMLTSPSGAGRLCGLQLRRCWSVHPLLLDELGVLARKLC